MYLEKNNGSPAQEKIIEEQSQDKIRGVEMGRVLVPVQVGVASLRRDKHTPCKNENSMPSDAASHALRPVSKLPDLRAANANPSALLL